MSMKRIYQVLAIGASLVLLGCNGQGGSDSNLNEERNEAAEEANTGKFAGKKQRDAEFVYEVVATNYGELKLAELANQRSRTASVKKIAEALVTDHSAALNELKTLAQAKAISVPVQETDAAKRKLEDIAEESGDDFDEEWVAEMLDLHEKSIDTFEKRLNDTDDAELKSFISKTLPLLQKHRDSLKACEESLK